MLPQHVIESFLFFNNFKVVEDFFKTFSAHVPKESSLKSPQNISKDDELKTGKNAIRFSFSWLFADKHKQLISWISKIVFNKFSSKIIVASMIEMI